MKKSASLLRTGIFAMTIPLLAATVSLVGGQTIIDTFDSGYPGSAGNGWQGGWLTSSPTGYTLSASIKNSPPLVSGGGNYLEGVVIATNGSGTNPALLKRRFDGSASTGVDRTAAHTVSFDFRGDTALSGSTEGFVIYNTSNGSSTGTGGDTTWALRVIDGQWRLLNGNGSGGVNTPNWVALAPYTMGVTYSFKIDVDPATKSWSVTASYSGTSVSSSVLNFRANTTTAGDFIYVGATGKGEDKTYVFGLDNVSISSIPEPAHAALLGTLGVLGLAAWSRSRRRAGSA